jgi:hypothetical protein
MNYTFGKILVERINGNLMLLKIIKNIKEVIIDKHIVIHVMVMIEVWVVVV